jgi:two-component system, chemotaxis family, sensor kinase Cph1
VDKLLSYSRLGRADLQLTPIDMNVLVNEVRRDVMRDAAGRTITWRIGTLPTVTADLMMLRMAVRDLVSNAVKYTRQKDVAVIEVGHQAERSADVFWIKDNGVGFDMQYSDKLFGVFQRLHRWEDYEGTGIGLANVRRVIERHGGCSWAEGKVDEGATFYFRLPHFMENRGAPYAQAHPAR